LINEELSNHLASIHKNSSKRILCIINKLAEAKRIDENLKQTNQMQ